MENRIECLEALKQQLMNTIQQQKHELETLRQKIQQQQLTRQPVVMSQSR
jgi:prefoldin subunit 5